MDCISPCWKDHGELCSWAANKEEKKILLVDEVLEHKGGRKGNDQREVRPPENRVTFGEQSPCTPGGNSRHQHRLGWPCRSREVALVTHCGPLQPDPSWDSGMFPGAHTLTPDDDRKQLFSSSSQKELNGSPV